MTTTIPSQTRPELETLAGVNERCESYGQAGQDNLTVRKIYGKDQIRYLRCRACGAEFSERKATALWNTKVSEEKALAVAEHLAEGCSLKATARLVKVNMSVVRRLKGKLGEHGGAYHDERVQDVQVAALEADERHGYAHAKGQAQWEAEVIDPESKFIVSHVQGQRDEQLIRRLLEDSAERLANRHRLSCSPMGKPVMPACFLRFSGRRIVPAERGTVGGSRPCVTVSHAP